MKSGPYIKPVQTITKIPEGRTTVVFDQLVEQLYDMGICVVTYEMIADGINLHLLGGYSLVIRRTGTYTLQGKAPEEIRQKLRKMEKGIA